MFNRFKKERNMLDLIKELSLAIITLFVIVVIGYAFFAVFGVAAFAIIPGVLLIGGGLVMAAMELKPVDNRRPAWHEKRS